MQHIQHFVPGQEGEDGCAAARLRWPIPSGVTQAYAEAYTEPGDLVLIPYCQGPREVREALAAQRRVLAANFDPLAVLVAREALVPVPQRELDGAVARLGDSLKQGVPLRQHLEQLYATTCPACQRAAVAEFYVWDREQEQPVDKQLRCRQCGWDGQAAVESEDRERLAEVPERGMHYFYVLDRVAPQAYAGQLRTKLESMLKLYSPRALYALAELTLKIEGLFPAGAVQYSLKVLLLDCLDRCSALAPLSGGAAARRTWSRPSRFLERNVWQAFEQAAARVRLQAPESEAALSETLEAFEAAAPTGEGQAPAAAFLGQLLVRDLRRALPPRSIHLVLFSPPPLEPSAWSLASLWGGWLLGAEAAAPLHALLRQRTPDPAWYAGVMAGALHSLADLLCDDGHLVLVLSGQRPAVLEALVLAASSIRLGVNCLVQSGSDYRLDLAPGHLQLAPGAGRAAAVPYPDLEEQVRQAALGAAVAAIRARGEPVPWLTLHAAMQLGLAQGGWLAVARDSQEKVHGALSLVEAQMEAVSESPELVQWPAGDGVERLWWVADARSTAPALSDRVEAAACELLQQASAVPDADFARCVYQRFPGVLAPDPALVTACLRSYGIELARGTWQLRPEDQSTVRETERRQMIEDLTTLGRRLGYRAAGWPPFDIAWSKAGQVQAAFAVRWQANLGDTLALSDRAPGVRPYLVMPGGRSALVSHKLARNPVWQQIVDEAGWQFIKYRHVRELLDQAEVDEYALRTIVGLDPIVEGDSVQLSLF